MYYPNNLKSVTATVLNAFIYLSHILRMHDVYLILIDSLNYKFKSGIYNGIRIKSTMTRT